MYGFRNSWKLGFAMLTFIMMLVAMLHPAPAQAAASSFTVSQKLPFDALVYIPCANGGAGEFVEITGTLHDLYSITFTANGGYSFKFLDNPQGVIGIGQSTGAKYQATGETSDQGSGEVGFEESFSNNFKIIGQGTGNNFLVHENYHITVNANGTLTSYVDNFSVECK